MQNEREYHSFENHNPMMLFSDSPGEIGFYEAAGKLLHFFRGNCLKLQEPQYTLSYSD